MAKVIDTRDGDVGQRKVIKADEVHVAPHVEIIDTPRSKDKEAELAFMNEYVDVFITRNNTPGEELFVDVGNAGVKQFIQRGVWQTVRRKYVEVLARAKPEILSTVEFTDSTGARSFEIRSAPMMAVNFTVQDKNPNGHAWLQRVLAEA